jgi:hypothetical protein
MSDIADCGDSGCILRDRSQPSGQRTNGGCQHLKLDQHETRRLVRALAAEVLRLRADLANLAKANNGET